MKELELSGAEVLRSRVARIRRAAAEYIAHESVKVRTMARRYLRDRPDSAELRQEAAAVEAWCEAALAELGAAIQGEKDALAVFEPHESAELDLPGMGVPDPDELKGRLTNQTHRAYEHVRNHGDLPDHPEAGRSGKKWRYHTPRAKELATIVDEEAPVKREQT